MPPTPLVPLPLPLPREAVVAPDPAIPDDEDEFSQLPFDCTTVGAEKARMSGELIASLRKIALYLLLKLAGRVHDSRGLVIKPVELRLGRGRRRRLCGGCQRRQRTRLDRNGRGAAVKVEDVGAEQHRLRLRISTAAGIHPCCVAGEERLRAVPHGALHELEPTVLSDSHGGRPEIVSAYTPRDKVLVDLLDSPSHGDVMRLLGLLLLPGD